MPRDPEIGATRRGLLLAFLLVAGVLLGSFDLHAFAHRREAPAAAAAHHPKPVHLDIDPTHLAPDCPACLVGLGSCRLPQPPSSMLASGGWGRLDPAAPRTAAAALPYRLPLSRAPPLP